MYQPLTNLKEEPIEAAYESFFSSNDVDEVPLIKHETDGVVKTEITVGGEISEDCAIVLSNEQNNSASQIPQIDGPSADPTSNKGLNEQRLDFSPSQNASFHNTDVDPSPEQKTSNTMKMELPGKYKRLFDGLKAFPEMTKDILPILEELIHFHNCICLLRKDLNLSRCEDCGRGFAHFRNKRIHKRYCVIQKIENRFAPANISEHTGPSLEPAESLPPVSKNSTESNAANKSVAKVSESSAVTIKEEKIELKGCGVNLEQTTDAIFPKSPASTSKRRCRKEKKEKCTEFEKGASWCSVTKSVCSKIPKVVEINQFNHKKIYPYHVFKFSGEMLFHSPFAISYKDELGTARNVFNTMFCNITDVGRLVPSLRGRTPYCQKVSRQKEEPPELELLPEVTTAAPKKRKPETPKSYQPKSNTKPDEIIKVPYKKIKITPCSSSQPNPSKFSFLCPDQGSVQSSRRSKATGPPPSNITKELNTAQGSTHAFSEFDFNDSSLHSDNGEIIPDVPAYRSTYQDDTKKQNVRKNIELYMLEKDFHRSYHINEIESRCLRKFLSNISNISNSRDRKDNWNWQDVLGILEKMQSTVPTQHKLEAIMHARRKLDPILSKRNHMQKFGLSAHDKRFLEIFMFGIANPTFKHIERANFIARCVKVSKLRSKFTKLISPDALLGLDFKTRSFIDTFAVKQFPQHPGDGALTQAKQILKILAKNQGRKLSESEDDVSSPEIMRSCPGSNSETNFLPTDEVTPFATLKSTSSHLPVPPENEDGMETSVDTPKSPPVDENKSEDSESSEAREKIDKQSNKVTLSKDIAASDVSDNTSKFDEAVPVSVEVTLGVGINDESRTDISGGATSLTKTRDSVQADAEKSSLNKTRQSLRVKNQLLKQGHSACKDVLKEGEKQDCDRSADRENGEVESDEFSFIDNHQACETSVDPPSVLDKRKDHSMSSVDDMFDICEVLGLARKKISDVNAKFHKNKECCDFECPKKFCSTKKIEFFDTLELPKELGPILSLCQIHFDEINRHFQTIKKDAKVRVKGTNKFCLFIKNRIAQDKEDSVSTGTQTNSYPGDYSNYLEYLTQADEVNKTVIQENAEAQKRIESLRDQLKSQASLMSDLEIQLSAERGLRKVLKTETDALIEANKQFSSLKIEIGDSELQQKFERLQKENEKLKQSNKTMEQELKSLQCSRVGFLVEKVRKLEEEKTAVVASNTALQQNLDEKKEEIESLEFSMQSVSEALRHQTKTVSTLSRKSLDTPAEEQQNHRVYSGYESLLAITCKVLGAKLESDGKKIDDPGVMRQICEDIAGEDNLFALFSKLFCSNSLCATDEELLCIEKRVLFLVNLIIYFYNAPKDEDDDNEPSGSNLREIL